MRLIPDGPVRRERATGPSALRWQPIAGSGTGATPVREEECGPFGRDGLKAGERGFPAPVME